MREFRNVEFQTEEGISIITINRPEQQNRLNRETMIEFVSALNICEENLATHVVVITGKGEYFCSGGQMDGFPDGDLMKQWTFADAFIKMMQGIYQLSKPVVAAVQGQHLRED